MGRIALALLMLAGCDYVFHLAEVGPYADPQDAPDDSISGDTTRQRPDGDPSGCPADYTSRLDTTASFYKLVLSNSHWSDAEKDCADDMPTGQTHLIVLSNRDEWAALITIPATYLTDDTWIGATATKNGNADFKWVTDENTGGFVVPAVKGTEPWEVDQPDSGSQCAEMRALSGALHDSDCSANSNYICECDGHPENTANF